MSYSSDSYQKSILGNGIRIVSEKIPFVRSVTIGLLIETGSRYEESEHNGVTHFIEHMIFKGTKKRTAQQIAYDIDSIGGCFDAFTSREYLGIAVKVLDEKVDVAVDIMADVLLQPTFDEILIDRERCVILEEIKMIQDTPDELIHDLLMNVIWNNHPLGRPISGAYNNVQQLSRADILSFYRDNFKSNNITIAVAGNIEHQRVIDIFQSRFGKLKQNCESISQQKPDFHAGQHLFYKDLEQVHLCLAYNGLRQDHPLRYVSYVYNTLLGGSMSSRLFQLIREEYGLAYAIYAYRSSYKDAGYLCVYAGCSSQNVNQVLDLSLRIVTKLASEVVSQEELERVKSQLKGNLVLGLESTYNRMNALAKQEIYFNRYISLDEMLDNIDKITAQDVLDYGEMTLECKPALVLIGPIDEHDISIAFD